MNNLKAERERTKEIEENQQQQQLLLSRTSKVCCGAFEMSLVYDAAAVMSMTPKQANDWVRYMDEVGWCFTNGNDVTSKNFRRSLRMWMKMSEKIEKRASRIRKRNCADAVDYEALAKERAEAKRREKAKDPREWEMCKERCTNCLEGGGCPTFAIPPQLREWPITSEECPGFARRDDYHGC